jgi:hypothetical protein
MTIATVARFPCRATVFGAGLKVMDAIVFFKI